MDMKSRPWAEVRSSRRIPNTSAPIPRLSTLTVFQPETGLFPEVLHASPPSLWHPSCLPDWAQRPPSWPLLRVQCQALPVGTVSQLLTAYLLGSWAFSSDKSATWEAEKGVGRGSCLLLWNIPQPQAPLHFLLKP